MFIRTERLFLRPAWGEDWQELFAAIADERIVRNLSRAPWPYTADDARAFVARAQNPHFPHFLITVPSALGSRVIGGIGLNQHGNWAELGYWLVPESWGCGYATEAASAVLRLARILGHRRIGARHFLDNPASGRVLEKVGFRRDDRIVEVYGAGRGATFPSRTYGLRFGTPFDCDDGPGLDDDGEEGMQAA